jgi:hypothetical protein
MARIGFAISKVRRRFGAGFMIGLDGLNVPAPAQFLKIHPKKSFAMGSSQVRRNLHLGQPQSATGQYAKAVRERKRFTGQKLSGARFFSNTSK